MNGNGATMREQAATRQHQIDARLDVLRLELNILQSEMAKGSLTFPQALDELLTLAHSYKDAYLPLERASLNVEII